MVAIGVHNNIGTQPQRRVVAGLVGARQPFARGVPNDMIGAVGPGDRHGIIGAAIVDDQHLHAVDASDLARNIVDHLGNRVGLVQHRDLDNQFHRGLAGGAAYGRSTIASLGWKERLTVHNMLGRFLMLYRAAIVLHRLAFVKCTRKKRSRGGVASPNPSTG